MLTRYLCITAGAFAVLGFASSAPAAAGLSEQYSPATLTPMKLFELNRHAVGSVQPGAYRIVARTESSTGDVSMAEAYKDGPDYRVIERHGDLIRSFGSYHGQGWNQDANGLVTRSTNVFEELDPFVASLRKPDEAASGVKVLGLTTGDDPQFVVEIAPESGLLERRYYDAKTYLLTKRERVGYDGRKQTWAYGGYSNEFGRQVARIVTSVMENSPVTTTERILTYERMQSPPDLSIPPSHRLFDLGAANAVSIPAEFTADAIFVTINIEGRGLDFELDSGSADLLIDPAIARELGMQSSGAERASALGAVALAETRAPSVTIGTLSANNVAFSTAAFQEQLEQRRIVGLLGADFIASGVLEVNFEKGKLTLYRSLPPDLPAKGWSALPIRLDDRVPMIKATFSKRPGTFVADLGAYESMLFPHYFAGFSIPVPAGTRDQGLGMGLANREFGFKHFTMNTLILGDWIFGAVQVIVPSATFAQDEDFDGLIGYNTLRNFDLIFDYADQQLWFKPIDYSTK